METKGNESETRKTLILLVMLAAILVPLVYALSAGPAAWLFVNHYISQKEFVAYVTPLAVFRGFLPPLDAVMNWYLSYWT